MKLDSAFLIIFTILSISPSLSQTAGGSPYAKYDIYDADGIKPEEYRQRRRAAMAKMDSCSFAVFRSNDPDNRNGDTDYRFRQNDNFLYLTGCNETNSTLMLSPEGIQIDSVTTVKELLFIREHSRTWSGNNLGTEGAREVLGFGIEGTQSAVLPSQKLKEILPKILYLKTILYYTPSLPDILFDPVSEKKFVASFEIKKDLAEKYPRVTLKKSGLLVNDLRAVKSPAELGFMRKAINATTAAQIEAMKSCEPGMYEYQLQAVIEFCFTFNGCEFYGFPSVVGSGSNALSFHYDANRRQMNTGELVVMDIGAEYHGYSADVTRTIPVNGIYSHEQKVVYEIVLAAQDAAFAEIKPGISMNKAEDKAMEAIGEGLMKLGVIKEKSQAQKYCPHGISHFLGLDTHDCGSKITLCPGMVFTVEPGVYISDSSDCNKKYWGIGIRVEDDVLVTETGYSVLSEAAPRKAEDIERLMKQKGIGNMEIGKK